MLGGSQAPPCPQGLVPLLLSSCTCFGLSSELLRLFPHHLEMTYLTSQGTYENLGEKIHIKFSTQYLAHSRFSTSSFSKYSLSADYTPGTLQGPRNHQQTKRTKRKNPCPHGVYTCSSMTGTGDGNRIQVAMEIPGEKSSLWRKCQGTGRRGQAPSSTPGGNTVSRAGLYLSGPLPRPSLPGPGPHLTQHPQPQQALLLGCHHKIVGVILVVHNVLQINACGLGEGEDKTKRGVSPYPVSPLQTPQPCLTSESWDHSLDCSGCPLHMGP